MNTIKEAIANHLQIPVAQVLEVQEWAFVFWARIQSARPKFISKQINQINQMNIDTPRPKGAGILGSTSLLALTELLQLE